MRTTHINLLVVLSQILILGSSSLVAASTPDATAAPYMGKKTATEFWAEFKQGNQQTWPDNQSAYKDGWIEGRLAAALSLNKHLASFNIHSDVNESVATLNGEVHSEIERELAENIARVIEGIDSVTNNILINETLTSAASVPNQERDFSQYVADVSTTAAIRAELLASKNLRGVDIHVDTVNDRVTLSGNVKSQDLRALAQAIAAKHNDVKGVLNNLRVEAQL